MMTITVAKYIAAPVEHVFEVFTDIERGAEYVSGVRKIEVMTSGGFRLGMRWRETREIMGRAISGEMEVTAFERNRTYTITNDNRGTRIDTRFSFEPLTGGARVSVELSLEPQSFSARLLTPIGWAMAGKLRDAIARDLDNLKSAAESQEVAA